MTKPAIHPYLEGWSNLKSVGITSLLTRRLSSFGASFTKQGSLIVGLINLKTIGYWPKRLNNGTGTLSLCIIESGRIGVNRFLTKSIEINKNIRDFITRDCYIRLSIVCFRQNRVEDAKANYQEAIKIEPLCKNGLYNGPQNSDSVISYTWEIKGGGPSGTNAKEVSAFI